MLLTSDPTASTNGVRILTDVSGINGLTGKVQIVSGGTVQDHNRVQIVTGMQNPSTMSLTEQQRVQIVTAGVPDISSMSLTTEQQNHVQILTSVPNSTAEVSLTEQQQNRMEIISNVPSNTTTVNEQKSRIQVIPNTRTVSLTEQLMSDISQQILNNVPIPNTSNIQEQNTHVIFQNNSERNNEHVHISSSERTDLHITANSLPETITNQQTAKLQMIANLPPNCAISLNEPSRFQIIPNAEYTVEDKTSNLNDVHKLKHLQLETSATADASQQVDSQRFHVISNLEEQQRFMRVNEEQNRIIVEHQRVLNTSTMSFNEQPSNGTEQQQRLIQQLEEQRKIQIITQLPQQQQQIQQQQQLQQLQQQQQHQQQQHQQQQLHQEQHTMQINEHQNKVTVKSMENYQEQLQQSVPQQQQRLHLLANQTQHKLSFQVKDVGVQKLNHMPCIANESQDKLPDYSFNSESIKNSSIIADDNGSSGDSDEGKINNQNTNMLHCVTVENLRSHANAFEGKTQNLNGAHQMYKPASRNPIVCSPSSVISPRCSPSPHSPLSGRSPSHQSPQSPNIINSCFTNRPNLTVVAQSSPPPSILTNNLNNQNQDSNPILMQGKPCAAVISHSLPHTDSNEQTKNCIDAGQSESYSVDRFTAQSTISSSSSGVNEMIPLNNGLMMLSPPISNQNSFLDTIPHSHPNLSINKTGIVQPCSKTNTIRGKKPKKSAVVKPMVFQSEDKEKHKDGLVCLNPVSVDGSHFSGQSVQTIQLTPQKQQVLIYLYRLIFM